MKSGEPLNEYVADGLYRPPLVPAEPNRKFGDVPLPENRVCAFSIEAPSQNMVPTFLVTRIPYCRAQLKPTWYCGSMVMGKASVRLSNPFLVSVTRLHIWPPVKVKPLSKAA